MKNTFSITHYRVYKNGTAVIKVSANDFKPVLAHHFKRGLPVEGLPDGNGHSIFSYSLPPDGQMFYGYGTQTRAMEKAKEGAQAYISQMIKEVERGIERLRQYRFDHYEDLNTALLDANIRRLEREMHIK